MGRKLAVIPVVRGSVVWPTTINSDVTPTGDALALEKGADSEAGLKKSFAANLKRKGYSYG